MSDLPDCRASASNSKGSAIGTLFQAPNLSPCLNHTMNNLLNREPLILPSAHIPSLFQDEYFIACQAFACNFKDMRVRIANSLFRFQSLRDGSIGFNNAFLMIP